MAHINQNPFEYVEADINTHHGRTTHNTKYKFCCTCRPHHKRRIFCGLIFMTIIFCLWYWWPIIFISNTIPMLLFNSDGNFKILQIADIHFGNGASDNCTDIVSFEYPCSSLNSTNFINKIIQLELPDLIVYTGDNIDAKASNALTALDAVFRRSDTIPWVAVLGNHDSESTLNRYQVMRYISSQPGNLVNPGTLAGRAHGFGNYIVSLMDMTKQTNLVNLYFFDSGDYWRNHKDKYDKIRISQIEWYREMSNKLNGNIISKSKPKSKIPAIVFFHIPIPEYHICSLENKTGSHNESPGSPKTNSGLFSEFIDQDEVRMINVGHDHINDFCGSCKGIWLCYGGGVGYSTYGRSDFSRRVRIIELKEFGQTIQTWKRLDLREKSYPIVDKTVL